VAGSDSLETTVLHEYFGRTTLTSTSRYPTTQIRDAALRSGMEHGIAQGYEKLAEILASLGATTIAQVTR
jgi:hypothetical protein